MSKLRNKLASLSGVLSDSAKLEIIKSLNTIYIDEFKQNAEYQKLSNEDKAKFEKWYIDTNAGSFDDFNWLFDEIEKVIVDKAKSYIDNVGDEVVESFKSDMNR